MSSIDDKVVSIRFDNALFERKVAETLRSLETLKQGLDFSNANRSAADLGKAVDQVDFSNMERGVDRVASRLGVLGAIGFTVIQDLTRQVLGFATRVGQSLIEPILGGGKNRALNIEQARFMFEGLGMDIESAMDSALTAVRGTAYGLDSAAKVAAQFGGAGVEAGDEMTAALRGISGIAAMTGRSYEEIGMVMTGIAGVGRVTGQDLMQFGVRGINVAAKLGEQMGKTEKEVRQLISNGEMDFRTFAAYMDDAFGEHATKANETYQGSLSNLRSALSRIGASIQTQRLENMRTIFNATTPAIDAIHESLLPLINVFTWFSTMGAKALVGFLEGLNFDNFAFGIAILSQTATKLMVIFGTLGKAAKEAFRDIFPKSETSTFITVTKAIDDFVQKIKMGGGTVEKFKNVFRGLFAAVSIGLEVFKGIFQVFGTIIGLFMPAGSGVLSLASGWGQLIVKLQEFLVKGGAISTYFQTISDALAAAGEKVREFFSALGGRATSLESNIGIVERVKNAFASLADTVRENMDSIRGFLEAAGSVVREVLGFIGDTLTSLKDKIVETFDFGDSVDALNTGLFIAILIAARSFIKKLNGLVDETSGIVESITEVFGGITETLEAMQLKLKAEALMKIAIAVGVLTASVLILSMIDADALAKALTAMATGFGQLAGMVLALSKIDITGAKLTALAAGLTLIGLSMILLSIAVKRFSDMEWEELGRGLAGVAGGLALLVGATLAMNKAGGPMIRAGIAMGIMAGALYLLSHAVKSFSDMEWEEMGRGLAGMSGGLLAVALALNFIPPSAPITAAGVLILAAALKVLASAVEDFADMDWDTLGRGLAGVAGGLLAVTLAMNFMPATSALGAVGFLIVAAGLKILAEAVKSFAEMDWGELARGLVGVSVAMLAIALAMNLMPPTMILTAVGLVIVASALKTIGEAVQEFASMDWGELIRGLVALAGTLLILVVATNAMTGAVTGAIAIFIVAQALGALAEVMVVLGGLSLAQIGTALLAIAGVLIILGVAALGAIKLMPGLAALSITLLSLGASFAMIGWGALQAARAIKMFAEHGADAFGVFKSSISEFVKMLPGLAADIALFIVRLATGIIEGLPPLIDAIVLALGALLDGLIELMPKVGELLDILLTEMIDLLREHQPRLVEAGFELIMSLLEGLEENAGDITEIIANVIIDIFETLTEHMPQMVEAGANLIIALLEGIGDQADAVMEAAVNLIVSLINGLNQNIGKIQEAAVNLVIDFIAGIASQMMALVEAGADILISLMTGIANNMIRVGNAATNIITTLIFTFANNANRLVSAGASALISFIQGIANNIMRVVQTGTNIITRMLSGISNSASRIVSAGANAIISFLQGVSNNVQRVITAGGRIVLDFIRGVANNAIRVTRAAADLIINFVNGLAAAIDEKAPQLRAAGRNLARAIIDGMTGGLASGASEVISSAVNIATDAINAAKNVLGINSPSRAFMELGAGIGEGLALGMRKDNLAPSAAKMLADRTIESFRSSIKQMSDKLVDLEDINPVITPVLDLSHVQSEAERLGDIMAVAPISPEASFDQARYILHTNDRRNTDTTPADMTEGRPEVIFNQYNNSPKALSTNDIYRSTKSQLAKAKEELNF